MRRREMRLASPTQAANCRIGLDPTHLISVCHNNGAGKPLFVCVQPHGLKGGETVSVRGTPDNDGADVVGINGVLAFHFVTQPFVGVTTGGRWDR